MNQSTVESLVQTHQDGQAAEGVLIARAREVFRVIALFNLTGQTDIERIKQWRSDYLAEHSLDSLPADPIFAGPQWDRAYVDAHGITVVSREYIGNSEYEYHRFILPFTWLWETPEQIEACLRSSLTAHLDQLEEHEAARVAVEVRLVDGSRYHETFDTTKAAQVFATMLEDAL